MEGGKEEEEKVGQGPNRGAVAGEQIVDPVSDVSQLLPPVD